MYSYHDKEAKVNGDGRPRTTVTSSSRGSQWHGSNGDYSVFTYHPFSGVGTASKSKIWLSLPIDFKISSMGRYDYTYHAPMLENCTKCRIYARSTVHSPQSTQGLNWWWPAAVGNILNLAVESFFSYMMQSQVSCINASALTSLLLLEEIWQTPAEATAMTSADIVHHLRLEEQNGLAECFVHVSRMRQVTDQMYRQFEGNPSNRIQYSGYYAPPTRKTRQSRQDQLLEKQ